MDTLKLSHGSGKMEGIPSLNTNTLSNPFCRQTNKNPNSICYKCYSHYSLQTFRMNAVDAFERNSRLLSGKIIPEDNIPFINVKYFRFQSHGELINTNHLLNLVNICIKNHHTTFTLWTKRKDLILEYGKYNTFPDNLILVYSSSKLDDKSKLPKHFNKVFTVFSKPYRYINCHGACKDCLKCYTKNKTIYINEVVKKYAKHKEVKNGRFKKIFSFIGKKSNK